MVVAPPPAARRFWTLPATGQAPRSASTGWHGYTLPAALPAALLDMQPRSLINGKMGLSHNCSHLLPPDFPYLPAAPRALRADDALSGPIGADARRLPVRCLLELLLHSITAG